VGKPRELLECEGQFFDRRDWAGVERHARFLFTASESHMRGNRLDVFLVEVEYDGDPVLALINRRYRIVRKRKHTNGISKKDVLR